MRYFILFYFIFLFELSSAQSNGGILSSNTVVCAGMNNGLLTVVSYTGSIVRWEYAYNTSGPWTPMVFTSNSYNYINLLQSTYFRVIVQQSGYAEANSNSVLVSCDNVSIGGTVSGSTLQCVNSSVTATLNGNTGSVTAWVYSMNNWITTTTLTTSNTLTTVLNPLTSTTQIRAIVKNGVCPAVYSSLISIIPASMSNGGVLTGLQNVCAGSNSVIITVSNYTGTIQYWESSNSSGGPFNSISATSNSLSISNLTQNTWYRAVVKNANCVQANSNIHAINVDQPSLGGYITGTQSVCAVNNSGSLQLIANTGSVSQWQSSTNAGSTWNPISNNGALYTFSNSLVNTIYRAKVQNGMCSPVFSNQFSVTAHPLPIVNFWASNACEKSSLSFSNVSIGSNLYSWDFNDGNSSSATNPTHTYLSSGTHTVKLTAISQFNCVDSIKHVITIFPKPSPNFVSQDTACFGNTILFTNSSNIITGSINQIVFNFNDGSPNSTINPVYHNFVSEGNYSVLIKAISNLGCSDSVSKTIKIFPKPISNFNVSNVCKGTPSLLSNTSFISSGSIQHAWNFGNAQISTSTNPVYTYSLAGTYTISLISTSNHNCLDSSFKQVHIHENPTITYNTNNACQGAKVIFNGSFSPAISSVSLTLGFGDGYYSNNFNSTHIYSLSGTYISSLTLVTDSGCVSSVSKLITIFPKPFANFNFNNTCAFDSILFTNSSTISSGLINYAWDFGNTIFSSDHSPKNLYALPGNYTVQLIINSEYDCSDTLTKPLLVFASPISEFTYNNSCDGFPISFTNTSSSNNGAIKSNIWNFGDNTFSFESDPIKQYLNQGTYSVTLITTTNEGCIDTLTKLVNVFDGPISNFDAKSSCITTATKFQNLSRLSSGSFTSKWNFGDDSTSVEYSTEYYYRKAGRFKASLKVVSNNGCMDSISKYVDCFPLPNLKVMNDTTITKGIGLTLTSSGANNYNWSPAIGLNNPTSPTPFANPDTSMTYILQGSDLNGCVNYDTLKINVKNEFLVIPYNILTPNANGLNDTWIIKNIETYPNNSVLIFDQWNQKVFEAKSYHNEWDGKNLKGELLPDATYYYILKLNDSKKVYSGYITLLRNKEGN